MLSYFEAKDVKHQEMCLQDAFRELLERWKVPTTTTTERTIFMGIVIICSSALNDDIFLMQEVIFPYLWLIYTLYYWNL